MKELFFPSTRCQFGAAVRDVTPPLGIYARSWGAALHDRMDGVHRMPLYLWRLGAAALVAAPNELYSSFQVNLRAEFPGLALLVLGVTNGTLGYLPPRDTYGKGIYQEWQSPYAPGCLEKTTAEAIAGVRELFR